MSKIVIEKAEITRKTKLGEKFHSIQLTPFSKTGQIKPGQFLHIKIPNSDIFFRRAFSVYDTAVTTGTVEILFKAVGKGTTLLADLHKGDWLDIVGPLGNGFVLPRRSENVIMAAGGVGMPPIYFLTRTIIEKGYQPKKIYFFYGGSRKDELIELSRIKKLGVNLILTTDDGSYGTKGLVTSAIEQFLDNNTERCRLYGCGPQGMMRAIDQLALKKGIQGQISLEAPMPCGIGVCLGCILPLREGGYTRVCREGPVYAIGEVLL